VVRKRRPEEFLADVLAKVAELEDSDRERILKAADQPGRVEALEASFRHAVKDA
jgi:hypothetical protein